MEDDGGDGNEGCEEVEGGAEADGYGGGGGGRVTAEEDGKGHSGGGWIVFLFAGGCGILQHMLGKDLEMWECFLS